ncbi:hypothetical protein QO002_001053 [Pararhizobium capsulatum DSM 1112]|uniref:Uncharacterized protein n=1 Tax=Pararhizobium capsulatum DSM 1112 TaxID=1121113 RepID=A0ABU0BKY8_9HYPH|nr:hypothetical protein [Pararhizobium capsulatum]MDQ0318915.1 hypothetical protein [Pararhizobium capsulatum DSM 1112]
MKDFEGEISERKQKGRLFALLWILFAAFAMQFVVSAQTFSSRLTALQNAGNFSVPDNKSSETVLSRHITRALPAADLRFIADRNDFKGTPGGPHPLLLPTAIALSTVAYGDMAHAQAVDCARQSSIGRLNRARGPPLLA